MDYEGPLIKNGKRVDGRAFDDLRQISIKAHVINEADGSAYIKWGNNKILVGVYGPKECLPKHIADPHKAVVRARYNMAPFAGKEGHGRSGPSRRSIEISKVVSDTFQNVILAEQFPRTMIEIFIDVLQSDGGTRCAAVTAASVALADAGIPMKDMVSAVAGGIIEDTLVLDLNYIEDSQGNADLAMAFTHRNKDVLLLQMEGDLPIDKFKELLKMGMDSTEYLYKIQKEALEEGYKNKPTESVVLDL
ncbi:exosome complex exonuclease Rrp41 [Candidatus Micrarchaeota archaeon]|nr:exosome complex exonuclease Rrp41 [Candidatus Micrarchaeota archaeon]